MAWKMEMSYNLSPHFISYYMRGPNYCWMLYNTLCLEPGLKVN
jgi:hypothetical protein